MKPGGQCHRLYGYLRENPGASSLEITLALDIVNVTGRASDLRAEGIGVRCAKRKDGRYGYSLESGPLTLGLEQAS